MLMYPVQCERCGSNPTIARSEGASRQTCSGYSTDLNPLCPHLPHLLSSRMKCERGTARKRACPKIDVESVRHLDKSDLSLEVFSFRNSFGHPSEEKFTKSLSYLSGLKEAM